MASPVHDSTAQSAFTGNNVSSNTCSVTTAGTNRILRATVLAIRVSGVPTISGIADVAGLTWARRSTNTVAITGSDNFVMETWWALAAAQLTADTVTVTGGGTYDHIEIIVESYSGCNLSAPFDPNGSLPSFFSYMNTDPGNRNTALAANVPAITTTNSNDMLIASWCSNALPGDRADTPTGWAARGTGNNTAGTYWDKICNEDFSKSAPVSSFPATFRDFANDYGIVADALTSDVAPNTKRSFAPYTGA